MFQEISNIIFLQKFLTWIRTAPLATGLVHQPENVALAGKQDDSLTHTQITIWPVMMKVDMAYTELSLCFRTRNEAPSSKNRDSPQLRSNRAQPPSYAIPRRRGQSCLTVILTNTFFFFFTLDM